MVVSGAAPSERARIVGVGKTPIGRLSSPPTALMIEALEMALADAGLAPDDLDGLVSMPSLSHPQCVNVPFDSNGSVK